MLEKLTLTRRAVALVALAFLSACHPPASTAFMHRGPESLIDVSSEVVSLNIATKKDVAELNKWIASDAPTRAELQCDAGTPSCREAVKVLEKKGVVVGVVPSDANTVTLVYERILARDCKQRYRTRNLSVYNEPSVSFGCAVSANVVQHVSDKSVFVNPALSDVPSAKGGVAAIQRNDSRVDHKDYTIGDALTSKASSN